MRRCPLPDARGRAGPTPRGAAVPSRRGGWLCGLAAAGVILSASFAFGQAASRAAGSQPTYRPAPPASSVALDEARLSELLAFVAAVTGLGLVVAGLLVQTARRQRDQENFRALLEGVPDAVFVHDVRGRILYCNRVACRRLKYKREELLGMATADIDAPEFARTFEKRLGHQLTHGALWYEGVHVAKDGGRIPVDINTSRITYRGQTAILCVMRDVTERKRAEEALRHRESLLRATLESTPDGIVVVDKNGKITHTNSRFEKMWNLPPEILKSRDETKLLSFIRDQLNDPEAFVTRVQELYRTSSAGFDTLRFTDGRVLERYSCSLLTDGGVTGRVWCFRDVTERKRAAEALEKSENRLRGILSAMVDLIFAFDRDGRFVYYHSGGRDEDYLPRAEFFGKKHGTAMPPHVNRPFQEAFQANRAGRAAAYEYWLEIDGQVRWFSAKLSPVFHDERFAGSVAVVRDITERKRAEESLRESESRMRSLFEGVDDALFVHDEQGRILDCNEAACRRLGYTREELLSMRTSQIDAPEFAEGFAERLAEQMAKGRLIWEGVHVARDGRRIPVDINSSVIDYQGRKAVLAVMRDLTERKQADEERRRLEAQIQHTQKLESLGVLAGGIAHDFNNLLVGILGNADLALMDMSPLAPARGSVEEIKRAAVRASELTTQMLAYSGKGRFVVKAVSLNELVEEMVHLLAVSISKKTSLRLALAGELPTVEVDPAQIRQVVMNLITNAADAISDAPGVITIGTGVIHADRGYLADTYLNEELPPGDYAYVEVSDTGCGMDTETKRRLFEPFFTTKFPGRGLGLAAVLGIIRGHRGAVEVTSDRGAGTKFRVLLPCSDKQPQPADQVVSDAEAWHGRGTILVADDEQGVRNVARMMLERMGFDVLVAADGRQAVECFRAHADGITAVLLDMTMPYMNGEEVFRSFQEIRPDVPVVLSSGYTEQDATSRFGKNGPAGFVQKPFQLSDLRQKLRAALAAAGAQLPG